jgi:haloacetate dehalogenase
MAGDCLRLMSSFGHGRFSVFGHDRGGYVALRLALDHPEAVERLILGDCLPISEHLARCDERFARQWWHWFFFAQPDKPKRAILADVDAWYAGVR